jgi:DNA polymerase III delta prime subunit
LPTPVIKSLLAIAYSNLVSQVFYRPATDFFLNSNAHNTINSFYKIRYANYDIRKMNEQRILEELLEILEANGVTIRNEPLGGSGGGLCTVKGKQIFFVDTDAPAAEVAALCAAAVAKIVDIEKVYLKPQVRQLIEAHSNTLSER